MIVDWDTVSIPKSSCFRLAKDDRRKFRSQTSDSWTDAATLVRAAREEKESEEKESVERRSKGRKVAEHCVFPMLCGSGGSKSRFAKAAGAEPSGRRRDEKLQSAVARNTFRSQNAQSTPFSEHFWTLICRKAPAKHIFEVTS